MAGKLATARPSSTIPFEKVWVYSIRGQGEPEGRRRLYAESKVFGEANLKDAASFSKWACADKLDKLRPGGAPRVELYNLDGMPYESLLLGFFSLLAGPSDQAQNRPKLNQVYLGFTRDGFASMDTEGDGTLTTRPLTFEGKYLFVNTACANGSLRAEVLGEDSKPIPPYTEAQCVPVQADRTLQAVRWKDGAYLSALTGKAVRIRFHLTRGSLYAFWASVHENGASLEPADRA